MTLTSIPRAVRALCVPASPGRGFLLRWVAAIALGMLLAGLAEYAVASAQMERRVLDGALQQQSVHAEHLQAMYEEGLAGSELQGALTLELEEIAEAHEIQQVTLFAADGAILGAAGDRGQREQEVEPETAVKVRAAAASQASSVEREKDAGEREQDGRYEFLLPVLTADGVLVLEVDQRAGVLDDLLHDLRTRKALGLLGSVLLAVPLSYLLGGKGLRRRHSLAERAADTDSLTGLAGRRPFRPLLEDALSASPARSVALALVDVDEFKQVNDRLGHSYGDRVLVALAESFAVLRASDTAFRLGGDEFAVVLTGTTDEQAMEVLERVRRVFAGRAPGIGFSCGIATSGPGELGLQELWERTDAALYEAKRRGRRQSVTFSATASVLTVSVDKLDAVRELLDPDVVLEVAFQPIWDLARGSVLGHEALLRLPSTNHLEGPQDAFDLAQRIGLAAELDTKARQAVLRIVGQQEWHGALFLNVHPDAVRGLDVASLVAETATAGLQPSDVVLEITEQAELEQPETLRTLKELRRRGFRLAMDDMGHGNAGLRALTHVHFDVLKIDRPVIAKLGTDAASAATVAAATAFVQRSGGWVIAEGVEDSAMLHAVTHDDHVAAGQSAILAGQGYLLGRPLPSPVPHDARLVVGVE